MLWLSSNILEDVAQILEKPSVETLTKISIVGETGMGKRELISHYVSQLGEKAFIIGHLDFLLHQFTAAFLIRHAMKYYLQTRLEFEEFLNTYSKSHQYYLTEKIRELPAKSEEKFDWFNQIFLEFLNFIVGRKIPVIILENINQLDSLQFGKMENYINSIGHFPVQVIYTINPAGPFKNELKTHHEIILTKPSIQTTESLIRNYFETSSLNARLITNHCYLKAGGNPLKIRLLSSSVYKNLLNPGQEEFLNIKTLQKIRLPETWDEIFSFVLLYQKEIAANLLAFLAHLGDPIRQEDLQNLLKKIKIKQSQISSWIESGFLQKIYWEGNICFMLHPPQFKKWLKNHVPVENLSDIIDKFSSLMNAGILNRIYQISDLMYDIGKIQQAVIFACKEGEFFKEIGDFEHSADRFYFAVRISESESIVLDNLENILESLSDIYMFMGGYENAFEILKKLRALYTSEEDEIAPSIKRKWLQVNLKMAEALVEMDSFQEARYLIRETRVKKFCEGETIGRCYELIGDIESNLAHADQAWHQYRKALGFYSDVKNFSHLIKIYSKLKSYLFENSHQYLDLINQILRSVTAQNGMQEFYAILLRDKIQLLLKNKSYTTALKHCYELWQILFYIYQPKLKVQLVFYLAEIYSQIGKWQLAHSHLKKINTDLYVLHRPELNVQTLIQLGMIYKEQALYGEAQRTLDIGMEISFRYGFHEQMNEIKLHLGHIYLLVHGLLRAHEFLKEVEEWSEKNQQTNILLLAKMYLSYYEVQHKRFEKARVILSQGKKLVNLSSNQIDYLNYLFYFSQWSLEMDRPDKSQRIVDLIIKKSREYPRYQASGYYLQGRLFRQNGNTTEAKNAFQKAINISDKCNFPYIRYLTFCENARLSRQVDSENVVRKIYRNSCKLIHNLAEYINDTILSTQFLESGFHEDIIRYCREQKLINIRLQDRADS